MLFVTNRTPRQSNRSRKNRKISFDLQDTTVSQNIYFCERLERDDYIEVGYETFFSRLKELPVNTQILLYIHGFNDTDEAKIFPNAKKLQSLINRVGDEDLVYVIPIIWPCDDDSIIALIDDYWDDQRAADYSGVAFARLLGKFDKWRREDEQIENPCTKRISLIAHSMGCRVLENTLSTWAELEGEGEVPLMFRNIFMVAGDVVNHTLESGEIGQEIPYAARNVVVYYASDDLVMPASKVANLKNRTLSRRLGMTGPEDLDAIPRNVYEVDCDNFNNSLDFPLGHRYFLDNNNGVISPIIGHMAEALKRGRVTPQKRHHELPRPVGL